MRISTLHLRNNLALAPMAEVTDIAFRILCRRYGAGLVYTEMVNVTAIERKNKSTLTLAMTCKEEAPVALQLFGSKTESIKKALKIIAETEYINPDIIDFNFGCPVPKVINQGAGAALLKRPAKIKEIIETLKANTDLPVTAKIRIAKNIEDTIKTAQIIESAGASAIAIHGRTVAQMYSGKADWSAIKAIKHAVSIPVIGNGDVWDRDDYLNIQKQTCCDFVMVGRAALGNPMIFREIQSGKKTTSDNKKKAFLEYLDLAKLYPHINHFRIKCQALRFTKGLHKGAELRNRISTATKLEDIFKLIQTHKE